MPKLRIAIIPTPSRLEEKHNVLYVTENYRQAIIDHGENPFLLLPPQSIDYVSIPCRETPDLT